MVPIGKPTQANYFFNWECLRPIMFPPQFVLTVLTSFMLVSCSILGSKCRGINHAFANIVGTTALPFTVPQDKNIELGR